MHLVNYSLVRITGANLFQREREVTESVALHYPNRGTRCFSCFQRVGCSCTGFHFHMMPATSKIHITTGTSVNSIFFMNLSQEAQSAKYWLLVS